MIFAFERNWIKVAHSANRACILGSFFQAAAIGFFTWELRRDLHAGSRWVGYDLVMIAFCASTIVWMLYRRRKMIRQLERHFSSRIKEISER